MKTILFTITFSFIATSIYLQFPSNDKRNIASVDKAQKKSRTFTNINYTRSMLTLDSSIPYKGLTNVPGRDGEYMKRLFGKLIQKADKLSKNKFYKPEIGVYKNYNTFLLTALQVPYHESSLTHFMNRDRSKCSVINTYSDKRVLQGRTVKQQILKEMAALRKDRDNSVVSMQEKEAIKKDLKKKQAWIDKIVPFIDKNMPKFYKALGRGKNIFKNCNSFAGQNNIQQMLFSNDYADVGMFMFNASSHPRVFAEGDVFDFDKTIAYGLGYLYNGHNNSGGFVSIVENAQSYSCLRGLEQSNPKKFALRLIRGVWAGQYNSGNTSQTCRFQKRSHKWAKNDRKYFLDLRKIYDDDLPEGSLWHSYLPAGSYEEKAFFELIGNVLNQTNNRTFLDVILRTDYNARDTISYENIPVEETEQIVESNDEQVVIENDAGEQLTVSLEEAPVNPIADPVVEVASSTEETPVQIPIEVIDNSTVADEATQTSTPTIDQIGDEVVRLVSADKDESEQVRPEDTTGDLPLVLDFKKTHIVIASSVNIRKRKSLVAGDICGNTMHRNDDSPVKLSVISDDNSEFLKISKAFIGDLIVKSECQNLNEFFIHRDYVDKIRDYDIIGKVKVKTFIPIRLGPGSKSQKTSRIIHPGIKVLTAEKIYSSKYVWYEFIDEDGARRWFYAGVNGKHVEFIND